MKESIKSIYEMLPLDLFSEFHAVEDTGLQENQNFLTDNLPDWNYIFHRENLGLAAAVNSAWGCVGSGIDYIFHMEDDFIFNEKINIKKMIHIIEAEPNITQVSLKRQPVSSEEIAAGGFMNFKTFEPIECKIYWGGEELNWVEHRSFFTLNPSIIPKVIFEQGWPEGNEAGMAERLYCEGSDYWGSYYGNLGSPPKVTHIGHYRSGDWKL